MLANEQDRTAFGYNFSAFLSAARSVMYFARAEALTIPNGQVWYDGQITGVVKFLKDRRDVSVHARPLSPKKDINVAITENVRLGAEFAAVVTRGGEPLPSPDELEVRAEPEPQQLTPETSVTVTETYRLREWKGPQDIKTLCQQYLTELRRIVADGQSRGLLTRPQPSQG